jgi:hypothetical protein
MSAPSLEGRVFGVVDAGEGEVSSETTFHYTESADMVSATYSGGGIRRGFLVGVRYGDVLDFRYAQLHIDGTTAGGRCRTQIEELGDGRLRLIETWSWESRDGSGRSVVEELPAWDASATDAAEHD